MKNYNCYTCGAFLQVYEIKESDIKEGQDKEYIGSVELVCNNRECKDYGKHHVDNFIDESGCGTW